MVNEAARILEEGVVSRPSDIDAVWLTGYGFPRFRGGPLFHADRVGLAQVLARIQAFRERFGEAYWSPAPLLEQLVSAGRGLTSEAK
jgi:3-hydroxyacyl-CoA dehydrogenase